MKPTVECPKCKRKIAVGRPTCTYCGATLPAAGELPPPAAEPGPKKYEVGNLTEVWLPPGDPGFGPLRMRLKGATLLTPTACACCLGPSEVRRNVTASNVRTLPGEMMSNTYKVETRTYSYPIPYCRHCADHLAGTLKKERCAAAGPAVSLAFFFDKRELELTFLNREFGLGVFQLNKR